MHVVLVVAGGCGWRGGGVEWVGGGGGEGCGEGMARGGGERGGEGCGVGAQQRGCGLTPSPGVFVMELHRADVVQVAQQREQAPAAGGVADGKCTRQWVPMAGTLAVQAGGTQLRRQPAVSPGAQLPQNNVGPVPAPCATSSLPTHLRCL